MNSRNPWFPRVVKILSRARRAAKSVSTRLPCGVFRPVRWPSKHPQYLYIDFTGANAKAVLGVYREQGLRAAVH